MGDDSCFREARECIKSQKKFLKGLLSALDGGDLEMRSGALWTTWVLHRYINYRLVGDVEKAMRGMENPE